MDENDTTMIEEKTENKEVRKRQRLYKTTILPFFGFLRLFPYMKKYGKNNIYDNNRRCGFILLILSIRCFSRYALNNFVAERRLASFRYL